MEDACENTCVEDKEEDDEEEEACESDCEGSGVGDCATNSCVDQCNDAEDDDDGADSPCEAAAACADAADDAEVTEDQVEECLNQNGLGGDDMSDYLDAFGDDPPQGCEGDDAPEECTCAEECGEAYDACTSSCASDDCAGEDEQDCLDDCQELKNDCAASCGTCSTTAECEEIVTCDETDSEGNFIERACCAPVYDDDGMPVIDEDGNEVRECACCCIVACTDQTDVYATSNTILVAHRKAVRGLLGKHWQGSAQVQAAEEEITQITGVMVDTLKMGVDYCGARLCKPIMSGVKQVEKYVTYGIEYAEAFDVQDPDTDDECLCTSYDQYAVPPNNESSFYHIQKCCIDEGEASCDIDCINLDREPRCDSVPGGTLDIDRMFPNCDSERCLPGAQEVKNIQEYWIFPSIYTIPNVGGGYMATLCGLYGCSGGPTGGACVFFGSLPGTLHLAGGTGGLFGNSTQGDGRWWRSGGPDKRTADICHFTGSHIDIPEIEYLDEPYQGNMAWYPPDPPLVNSGAVLAYNEQFKTGECDDICLNLYEDRDPNRPWDVLGCYRTDITANDKKNFSCANAGQAGVFGGQCMIQQEFCSSPADCGPDYENDCGGTEVCQP
jgi:hypothetical protein